MGLLVSAVDNYFVVNNIDYDMVEEQIAKQISSSYMKITLLTEYWQVSLPTNDEADFLVFLPDDSIYINSFQNARHTRHYNKDIPLTMITETDFTNLSAFDIDKSDEIFLGFHGKGIIFLLEEEAREIVMKVLVTNKTPENLHTSFRDNLKQAYYYLSNGDVDNTYHYIRMLSAEKLNIKNEFKHQRHRILKRRGAIQPFQL